jgi:thiol:disulfide interchange protein DsbD
MKRLSFLALLLCAALAAPAQSRAQTIVENEYTTTEVIPEAAGFASGETLWFALRQELRDGWHVFWVNPGDAGLPLRLEWDLPPGYEAGETLHPVPEYIPVGPLASYAHEGAPVFLVAVTAPADARPGDEVSVAIEASWQACEDICVPEEGRFAFTLPVTQTPAPNVSHTELFAAARAALPESYSGDASFAGEGNGYALRLAAPGDFNDDGAFFFAAPEGLIEPSGAQAATVENGAVRIAMKPGWTDGFDGPRLDGVLTYKTADGGRKGLALSADIVAPIRKPQAPAIAANVPLLLLLAFLGGVILNIMPCVFPVVFIKAASFMQSAREHPGDVRRQGLFYTAGVLATFALTGGALLALRAGGEQLGWGFHLQSPAVTALSAYVLLLVGLNLAGVFSAGQSLAGAGEGLASKGGSAGAFFTGALAVVVAAPCIGPLLSAPMGAALLLPPLAGMAIFLALGLGLAAPYLALSFAPGLARKLPKPGRWMVTFKQVLAFPVFGAAAYFLWVLAQQASGTGLGAVLAGSVLLAFAAWSFERSKGEGARALVLRGVSALAAVLALAPLFRIEAAPAAASVETYGAMTAERYSDAALERYRAAGTPVFVDFTAAWCVTCQFNKAAIFSDPALAQDFAAAGAVFMVADWTVRDPEITAALQRFGASGVPLYVFYPGEGEPRVFSLPLSKDAVRRALSGA